MSSAGEGDMNIEQCAGFRFPYGKFDVEILKRHRTREGFCRKENSPVRLFSAKRCEELCSEQ